MPEWTDTIVGDRMAVDDQFSGRIDDSEFTRQEWGLIMTAVEFDIRNADDPERAELVADTSALPSVMPELERVAKLSQGGPGAVERDSGGGLLDGVKEALGLGGGGDDVDEERLAAAERLTSAYADELQAHLEERGRWDEVRAAYTG